MAKTVIDSFELGARESVKDSGGSVFAIKYHTQVFDAVKFNMADRVQFLNLAAHIVLKIGNGRLFTRSRSGE